MQLNLAAQNGDISIRYENSDRSKTDVFVDSLGSVLDPIYRALLTEYAFYQKAELELKEMNSKNVKKSN